MYKYASGIPLSNQSCRYAGAAGRMMIVALVRLLRWLIKSLRANPYNIDCFLISQKGIQDVKNRPENKLFHQVHAEVSMSENIKNNIRINKYIIMITRKVNMDIELVKSAVV